MRIHRMLLVSIFTAVMVLQARAADQPVVYLDPAHPFSNPFAAGAVKKRVPVTLTHDESKAQFAVTFTAESRAGSRVQGVTTAVMTGVYLDGSSERITMSVVDLQSQNLIFSYTCTKMGGRTQSAAECLAKHWKKSLRAGTKP